MEAEEKRESGQQESAFTIQTINIPSCTVRSKRETTSLLVDKVSEDDQLVAVQALEADQEIKVGEVELKTAAIDIDKEKAAEEIRELYLQHLPLDLSLSFSAAPATSFPGHCKRKTLMLMLQFPSSAYNSFLQELYTPNCGIEELGN
ncbi:hypothetical protein FKM82_028319 [Ascaphus truei]